MRNRPCNARSSPLTKVLWVLAEIDERGSLALPAYFRMACSAALTLYIVVRGQCRCVSSRPIFQRARNSVRSRKSIDLLEDRRDITSLDQQAFVRQFWRKLIDSPPSELSVKRWARGDRGDIIRFSVYRKTAPPRSELNHSARDRSFESRAVTVDSRAERLARDRVSIGSAELRQKIE